ncbi:MAG TPA: hypothetical protein VK611_27840 [Acidimicrobiales bacterium]|nr:hypothetical protein [Acidimicrobiales bacterium]
MYDFAIVALLALATIKAVDFVCDLFDVVERFRSLLTFIAGIGAVVWLDFSVFTNWNIDIRNDDTGVWLTGFMVVGATIPWRAIFRYLTHDQATGDESLGERGHMLRAVDADAA